MNHMGKTATALIGKKYNLHWAGADPALIYWRLKWKLQKIEILGSSLFLLRQWPQSLRWWRIYGMNHRMK